MDPQDSLGIPRRMAENPLPGSPSHHAGEFTRGVPGDTGRGAEPGFETCGCAGRPLQGPVHQSAISGGEEGQDLPSCDQLEAPKLLRHGSPFQNGRVEHDQGCPSTQGLDVLSRPQGRLPLSVNNTRTPQIPLFYLGWRDIRIHLPPL